MRANGEEAERAPLLLASPSVEATPIIDSIPKLPTNRVRILGIVVICFILVLGEYLFEMPGPRIYEDIICRHYYGDIAKRNGGVAPKGKIDEQLCKGEAVQKELAFVIAGIQLLIQVPCLLMSFPAGLLANRIGRKKVLFICVTGNLMYMIWVCGITWFPEIFPLRLIWFGPVWFFLGGGEKVASNMIYSIVTDLSDEAGRANNFFLIVCGTQVSGFIAPAVAAFLMTYSPWIPRLLAFPVWGIGMLLITFIPESPHILQKSGDTEDSSESHPSRFSDSKRALSLTSIGSKISVTFAQARAIPHIVSIVLLLITFISQAFTRMVVEFTVRFSSKRFSLPLADANYFVTLSSAVNILLLLVILPILSHLLTSPLSTNKSMFSFFSLRRGLTIPQKDLTLARGSIILLVIGACFIGLSAFRSTIAFTLTVSGVMIYTAGSAVPPICRSLLTSLAQPHHVAILYACISVVETIGALVCAPGLAWMYALGLRWAKLDSPSGGELAWLGLPFWGTALWILFYGGCAFIASVPTRGNDEEEAAVLSLEEAEFLEERPLGEFGH